MQNNGRRFGRAEATDIVKLRVCDIENRCIVRLTVQIDIGHGRRMKRKKRSVTKNERWSELGHKNGKTPNRGDCGHQRNQLFLIQDPRRLLQVLD